MDIGMKYETQRQTEMCLSWKIFVISLRSVRERRQKVIKQLIPLGLPFEIVDAIDFQQVKSELLAREDEPPRMREGMVACYHPHLEILQRIDDYGLDYGLVLEDDFILGNAPTLTLANIWERIPHGAGHVEMHSGERWSPRGWGIPHSKMYPGCRAQ
jgi:GR25 family glycosyltransferase involved in LPS biosynthesis